MKHYLPLLAGLSLSACVDNGYRPLALEQDFGHSVRQTTQAQILNPNAAANPPLEAGKKGRDGIAGQSVINAYRASFGQAQTIHPITINVGSGSK